MAEHLLDTSITSHTESPLEFISNIFQTPLGTITNVNATHFQNLFKGRICFTSELGRDQYFILLFQK